MDGDHSFRHWLLANEVIAGSAGPAMDDPSLKGARDVAVKAAATASQKGDSPVDAVKQSVIKSVKSGNVPLNKMGDLMPEDPDDKTAGMKKQMKEKMKK